MPPQQQSASAPRLIRVCHLSTVHSADDSRVFWREAVGLATAGYDVTLAARADTDATREGVRVVALKTYRRRLVRMTWGVARAYAVALRSHARIVHVHDPELIPLLLLLRLAGKRVVYDAHEYLSRQVAAKQYLPGPARRAAAALARALEWFVGRVAHRIVTVNAACASVYPPRKVAVVANFPERARFPLAAPVPGTDDGGDVVRGHAAAPAPKAAPTAPAPEHSTPEFVYVGGISAARGVTEMVDAIDLLAAGDAARLRLVGRFSPPALEQQLAQRPGWRHVDYAGLVPHDVVAEYLRGAVAGLATLQSTPNHLISSPVKVFEYMAMGLPVILSDFPRWRELLDGVDCAIWVDPADPAAIAAAMRELLHNPERRAAMSRAATDAVAQRFNWDTQLRALVDVYRSLV